MRNKLFKKISVILCVAITLTSAFGEVPAYADVIESIDAETIESIDAETIESIDADAAETENIETSETAEIEEASGQDESFNEILSKYDIWGYVYNAETYDIKAEPDRASQTVRCLDTGDALFIRGYAINEDNVLWYRVQIVATCEGELQADMPEGYIERYNLAVDCPELIEWEDNFLSKNTASENCVKSSELELVGVGSSVNSDLSVFPEAYVPYLSALQTAHPTWQFVKQNMNVSFAASVKKEAGYTSGGVPYSLIEKSAPAEYVTSKQYQGNWYVASQKGVEHYMNPFTYFDEKHIFAFENIAYSGGYQNQDTVQQLFNKSSSASWLRGTIPGDSKTYAAALTEIGSTTGIMVSPVHLAARVMQEQGDGSSPLISGTYSGYEGYYNYYNIQASGSSREQIYKNGLAYAKTQGWNTRYKSLKGGAKFISDSYVSRGQNTIYLEKWYPATMHQYMQNVRAAYAEAEKVKNAYSGILDRAFIFRIPVYTDTVTPEGVHGYSKAYSNADKGYLVTTIEDGVVTGKVPDQCYTGAAIKPYVDVYVDGIKLVNGKDYTVKYSNNKKVSTASNKTPTIKIIGKGNYYGTVYSYFSISSNGGTSWSDAKKISSVSKLPAITTYNPLDPAPFYTQTGYVVKGPKGVVLTEGLDYIVNYNRNSKPGTAQMIVYGINGYKGTIVKSFKIKPYFITNNTAGFEVRTEDGRVLDAKGSVSCDYVKNGIKLPVKVTISGNELVEGKDYALKYSNYKAAGVATVSIIGKGRFTGTVSRSYTIYKKNMSDSRLTALFSAARDTGKAGNGRAKISIYDENGKLLVAGKDYDKLIKYTYAEDSANKKAGDLLGRFDVVPAGTKINVTVVGINNYVKSNTFTYTVAQKSINKVAATALMKTYNGKQQTISSNDVTVSNLEQGIVTTLTPYKDFEVVGPFTKNKSKGKACAFIRGIGDYTGFKKIKFTIKRLAINE